MEWLVKMSSAGVCQKIALGAPGLILLFLLGQGDNLAFADHPGHGDEGGEEPVPEAPATEDPGPEEPATEDPGPEEPVQETVEPEVDLVEELRKEAVREVKGALSRSSGRLIVQDHRLDNVASWMAATALGEGAARSAVRKRLWQEEIRDFEFFPAVTIGDPDTLIAALSALLTDSAVDWTRFNTLGVAAREDDGGTAVAIVLTRRAVTFVGREEPRNQVFAGSDYTKLEVFATDPAGQVHRRSAEVSEGLWTLDLRAGSAGSWLFEVVGHGERGPEIVALWPRQGRPGTSKDRGPFGKQSRAPVPAATPEDAAAWVLGGARGPDRSPGPDDVRAAETHLWTLVQESRSGRGLPALERLDGVTAAARRQAGDIGRGEPFGHHTSSGTALDRLADEGVLASRVVENVAVAADVASAHAALLASPAHRANILDSNLEAGGVGVVLRRDSRGRWSAVISEVFVELLPGLIEREALLLESLNAARREAGLLELKSSRVLGDEAREAAEWVVASAGLSLPDPMRKRLAEKVRFHYVGVGRVGIDLMVTNDIAAGAGLADVRGRTYDEVGIGAAVLKQRIGAHPPGTLVVVLLFVER